MRNLRAKLKCWSSNHQWKLDWTEHVFTNRTHNTDKETFTQLVLAGSECLRCGKYRAA